MMCSCGADDVEVFAAADAQKTTPGEPAGNEIRVYGLPEPEEVKG
jgi:hypothetical protein